MFASLITVEEDHMFCVLFEAWLPGDVVVAVHGSGSQKALVARQPPTPKFYTMKVSTMRHIYFGGISVEIQFEVIFHNRQPFHFLSLMRATHFSQTLIR